MKVFKLVYSTVLACLAVGCTHEALPKPRGYFRIDVPEKSYHVFEGKCPFTIEVPDYSRIEIVENHNSLDSCWFNIAIPRLNARIHCTYLPVSGNLDKLLRDAFEYAFKHEAKASAIDRIIISDDATRVYGLIYDIKGNVASQVQFYCTDSVHHFLRGSLYFENMPNADSLAPVVGFLKADIMHLAESLEWVETTADTRDRKKEQPTP